MTPLWLIVVAIVIYSLLLIWITLRIRKDFDELLPDAVVNRDATPPEQYPTVAQHIERNHVRAING